MPFGEGLPGWQDAFILSVFVHPEEASALCSPSRRTLLIVARERRLAHHPGRVGLCSSYGT
jgi:hypothetical protein